MLRNLILSPIEYFLDLVFCVMVRFLDDYGLAIIFVSLAVQLLTLPLYRKSDEIQEAERAKQKSMEHWVSHIKKTFSGNERFMMLSTYYRQENYRPVSALKGSVSLLLQIPFFIAAYNFLTSLTALNGMSFSVIRNLGEPDGLITLAGLSINLLPILMTVINIVSGMIYTKGFTAKEKVQLYGMALIFLVILYDRPSGLVLYWTMNNVFSLVKNIFTKLVRDRRRFLSFASPLCGALLMLYVFFLIEEKSMRANRLACAIFALSFLPSLFYVLKKRNPAALSFHIRKQTSGDTALFLLSGLFLSLFIGTLIPFSVVSSSPLEFFYKTYGPLNLVFNTAMTALGFFCVWGFIFYSLGSPASRTAFRYLYLILTTVFLVDFFFFGKNLGTVSSFLVFDRTPAFTGMEKLFNIAILFAVAAAFVLLMGKIRGKGRYVYIVLCLSLLSYCTVCAIRVGNAVNSYTSRKEYTDSVSTSDRKIIPLSKNGKNVVLFMLDRAVSAYVPDIMNDVPEVRQAFSDFVYYPDTVSFGGHTNLGSPALFGGYEYSPEAMNRRSTEKLVDKHNEALKVLPVLFMNNGYEVTVCDPPYAGYSWIPDLSIYDEYPGINAYNLTGLFTQKYFPGDPGSQEKSQSRSLFFYSVMKAVPLFIQKPLYDGGRYGTSLMLQNGSDLKDSLSTLIALPDITYINNNETGTFLMIQNETPHENINPFTVYDFNYAQVPEDTYYAVNMASYIQIARWIRFMKDNGVYDNTRIIIVADHGIDLGQYPYMLLPNGVDVQYYNPVLMVKDFTDGKTGSQEYTTDNSFMTNADAAVEAVKGLFGTPVNPFTGIPLDGHQKFEEAQHVTTSDNFLAEGVTSTTFNTSDGKWYEVSKNIFDADNWKETKL